MQYSSLQQAGLQRSPPREEGRDSPIEQGIVIALRKCHVVLLFVVSNCCTIMESKSTLAEADSTSMLALPQSHPQSSVSQTSPALLSPSHSPTVLSPAQSPKHMSPSQSPSAIPVSGSSPTVLSPSESLSDPSQPSTVQPSSLSSSVISPPEQPSPGSIWAESVSSLPYVPLSLSPPNENKAPLMQSNDSPSSISSSTAGNPQFPLAVPMNPDSFYLLNTQPSSKTWRYDPLASPDWDCAGPPGCLCAGRVKKDLSSIYTEPLPGIFVVPEEQNLFKVHCLIIGPFDTPYEGGFFHFLVRFGPQYPLHPPRVRLLTTGGDTVRFNPNLYKNGKVCLSILGTWSGPAWSPASNLSSVLLSLQSLMNENPYHNEPGFEKERKAGDSKRYNTIIMHETIRVSVVQQLEGVTMIPSDLMRVMEASFLEYYDHYVEICEKNMHLDGQTMVDPFREWRGHFQYATLLKHLKRLKSKIEVKEDTEVPENPITAESDDVSSISEDKPEP
ncbi:ubiquitin-conjugating enzyme E2 Z-like isoform X2 [Penaeus japonicus]|uniref:ubiquitin-conjugating enzyme E2 Z-like isoform X2 n=1 Tax=Penaeus japonicus TaxID=27405 RepID=UPI001C715244|nr:ubiquitin-conjugating enzyme E2 Z-like isoform X2 [Penaeus japonicus]